VNRKRDMPIGKKLADLGLDPGEEELEIE